MRPTAFVSVLLSGALFFTAATTGAQAADPAALTEAIVLSSRYLVANAGKNGMFEYLENMNPDVDQDDGYNILRHAGTIYALSMAHRHNPDKKVLQTMVRAGQYLHIEAIGPIPGRNDMLAVWSRPEVNREGETLEAKLGGNGLGLAALLCIEQDLPGFTPTEALRKLGAFILFMQKKDGGFYSKYAPHKGGYQKDFVSLYYPGEAALGLLMLYEKDPLEIWQKSAIAALTYLATSRRGQAEVPVDHWALLATAKLFALADQRSLAFDRELLISHAAQICRVIVAEQVNAPQLPLYHGGFTPDGRTTPAATRLEGLLAALTFIPDKHELYPRIERAVHAGMSFLLNSQVKQGEFAGAVPFAVAKVKSGSPAADEFNRRATEIRVDYVQHALSAMVQYHDFLRASASPR